MSQSITKSDQNQNGILGYVKQENNNKEKGTTTDNKNKINLEDINKKEAINNKKDDNDKEEDIEFSNNDKRGSRPSSPDFGGSRTYDENSNQPKNTLNINDQQQNDIKEQEDNKFSNSAKRGSRPSSPDFGGSNKTQPTTNDNNSDNVDHSNRVDNVEPDQTAKKSDENHDTATQNAKQSTSNQKASDDIEEKKVMDDDEEPQNGTQNNINNFQNNNKKKEFEMPWYLKPTAHRSTNSTLMQRSSISSRSNIRKTQSYRVHYIPRSKNTTTYHSSDSTTMMKSPYYKEYKQSDNYVMLKNEETKKYYGLNIYRGSPELIEKPAAYNDPAFSWFIVDGEPTTGNSMVLQSVKYKEYYYFFNYDPDYKGSKPLTLCRIAEC